MDAEKNNQKRQLCLDHTEELLKGALILLDGKLDHLSFHLSTLALEEIGKISLIATQAIASDAGKYPNINLDTDDHEKNLFWAIWGPSFGRQKVTQKQLEEQQGLAKNIHKRRKDYLYTDPSNPVTWRQKMEEGEAQSLYDFANTRYQLEIANGGMRTDMTDKESQTLKWFLDACDDPEKRNQIFGNKSQEKLIELGSVHDWIEWLKGVYDKNEEEMLELVKAELARKKPATKEEAEKQKWRVKMKIVTPSHSIRNSKCFLAFNEHSDYIKLFAVDKNTLTLQLFLSKNVPVHAVWDQGWMISRMFVTALNIATRGLFWWNVPVDTARYYEEIWDIENNHGVAVEMNPKLELNWKEMRWVLRPVDLTVTSVVFAYLSHLKTQDNMEALNLYASGLSLLAKNDVHLRLEMNSFEQFYLSLKTALAKNAHWDGKTDLVAAVFAQIKWLYKGDMESLKEVFGLAAEIESAHQSSKPITLSEVMIMKSFCDIYFLKLAKAYIEIREGKEFRFVAGEEDDQTEDTPSST